mgnify:CR=1 FL=1
MSLLNRFTEASSAQSRLACRLLVIVLICFVVGFVLPLPRSGRAREVVQWSSKPSRNIVLEAKDLPARLGSDNLLWEVKRGRHHFASPVIAGSKLLVGGDTTWLADERLRAIGGRRHGGIACLDLQTGQVLWELLTPPFAGDEHGVFGVCSTPVVEGDRVYGVGTRGNVLCLDLNGQADGNDGPFVDELAYMSTGGREALAELKATDGDIIWRYDILEHHPVLIHDAYAATPLIQDGLLWVPTCHSIGSEPVRHLLPSDTEKDKKLFEKHHRLNTPHLLVLNKQTGELVAVGNTVVKQVFHGQWSSPCMGIVDDRPLVFWGDGYGVLHAYEPPNADSVPGEDVQVLKEVWWCDVNPREYRYDEEGELRPYPSGAYRFREGEFEGTHKEYLAKKNEGPCQIIGTPVFHQDRIYVAIGRDVNEGRGPGRVICIDPRGTGDITDNGVVWASTDVGKSMLTPAVANGLLYMGDTNGMFHCFDAATGEKKWEHRVGRSIEYCSPLLADGKVYVFDNNGRMGIFRHGAEKVVLFEDRTRHHESSSMTATDGSLIVPDSRSITAYGKSGDPATGSGTAVEQ